MKYIVCTVITLLLTLFNSTVYAQDSLSWEDFVNDYATEETDENSLTESFEKLTDLHEHRLNINTASRDELGALPFLSDKQIEDILAYIYSYGAMKTMGELMMIESLDYETRQKLMRFIYVGDVDSRHFPSLQNILKYEKQDLLVSASIPFYNREGDRNGYLGYKYRHSLRYSYRYGNNVKFGIVGAQGAGEPFFANRNKMGYDYYSYYLIINDYHRLKALALGCYKLSFGMGLVVNSSYYLGKLAALSSLGMVSRGISAHSSTSESGYFHGIAANVEIKEGLTFTGFASYRFFDATLNSDGNISTMLTSGYHRTQNEMDKKGNSSATDFGGNINFRWRDAHVGISTIYSSLNRILQPNTSTVYRMYYPSGRQFSNASVDYGFLNRFFVFNGETATGTCGGLATLNNLSIHVNKKMDVMIIQRFYSYRYSSLYASGFSEGGDISNESGVYVGTNWRPVYGWNVTAYTDWYYFAWPRYQVSTSSHGCDNFVSVTYKGKRVEWDARYRLHVRQKDNEEKTTLNDDIGQRARTRFRIRLNDKVESGTQLDGIVSSTGRAREHGYMVSEHVGYVFSDKLNAGATFGYFHTDSYKSRISIYEGGLLYRFSFPSYYGEGIRLSATFRTDIGQRITLISKIGMTDYFDRDHIGSGLQQISHSSQTDCDIQLRWKF